MDLRLTPFIGVPVIDWLGGTAGPFSGPTPNLQSWITDSNHDAYLCPHDLFDIQKNKGYLSELLKLATNNYVIASNRGDKPIHLCHPRIISFQTSIEVGTYCSNHPTIVVPYNVEVNSTLISRAFPNQPTTSFVGYVPSLTLGRLWRSFFPFPPRIIKRNGALIRRIGLRSLSKISGSKIIAHNSYSATHKIAREEPDRREQYAQSIIDSDLVFAPRGDGNSSQRLYETLASGRVPIIPNTDMFLPRILEEMSSRFILFVNPTSNDLDQAVELFWEGLDEERYLQLQREIFDFYNTELRYKDFIERLFSLSVDEMLDKYTTIYRPIS